MSGLGSIVLSYLRAKLAFEQSVPFSPEWLHVLVGPVIFVAAAIAMGRPAVPWAPWLVVLALALLNEGADLAGVRLNMPEFSLSYYAESLRDVLLTIALPTVMLILSAARRRPFYRRARVEAGAGVAQPVKRIEE